MSRHKPIGKKVYNKRGGERVVFEDAEGTPYVMEGSLSRSMLRFGRYDREGMLLTRDMAAGLAARLMLWYGTGKLTENKNSETEGRTK